MQRNNKAGADYGARFYFLARIIVVVRGCSPK